MKTKSTLRACAWLLTLCTAIPVLASCGGDGTAAVETDAKTDAVTETAVETEPLDALDARKLVDDELGEQDLGGYEFRIVTTDNKGETIWVEEATGDVIDDAVYTRNATVEERFNTKIVLAMDKPYTDVFSAVTRSITAGEDAYDLLSAHVVGLGQISISNYFLNWYDIPHIDFEKPWWSDSTVNDLTYNGVCVTAIGDMALSALSAAYCVFYNKRLGAEYDFDDLYAVVNDGKWTLDYITSITKDIYRDLNGNGAIDTQNDLFGYLSDPYSNMNAYLWAFENPVFKKNGDVLEYTYKTEKVSEIVTKLCDTFSLYDGIKFDKTHKNAENGSAHSFGRDMFAKGQAVLSNGYISMSLTHFRELEDEFGILPYPKWDEAQTRYYSAIDAGASVLTVPTTAQNTEMIGAVVEVLSAESWKGVMPTFYDTVMDSKIANDEGTVRMLDTIFDSRVIDFAYLYDGWNGWVFKMQSLLTGTQDFASFYAKQEKAVSKHYQKVLDIFLNDLE